MLKLAAFLCLLTLFKYRPVFQNGRMDFLSHHRGITMKRISNSCVTDLSFFTFNHSASGVFMTFIDSSTSEFGLLIELANSGYWANLGFMIDQNGEKQATHEKNRKHKLFTLLLEEQKRIRCKTEMGRSFLLRRQNPYFIEWRCKIRIPQNVFLDEVQQVLNVKSVDVELFVDDNEKESTSLQACATAGKFKRRLALCTAPLHDVSSKLAEWFGYHIYLGIDQFLLYEHFSSSKHLKLSDELLNALAKSNFGIRHNFTIGNGVSYPSDSFRYKLKPGLNLGLRLQTLAQNHCLYTYRNSFEWLLYIDVDEFVFLPENNTAENLEHILNSFARDENFCALKVKNMLYGSAITKNLNSCLVTSRYRTRKLNVVRGKRQKFFARGGIHGAAVVTTHFPLMCRKLGVCDGRGYGTCSEGVIPINSKIMRVNHYPLTNGYRSYLAKKGRNDYKLLRQDILEGGEDTNEFVVDSSLDKLSYDISMCISRCDKINITCVKSI